MRGGCVQTIENPNPFSGDLMSFFVIVNGVRPLPLPIDDWRDWVSVGGGSNSRKRRNKFSSASHWCWAFLLNAMSLLLLLFCCLSPVAQSFAFTISSTHELEFPYIFHNIRNTRSFSFAAVFSCYFYVHLELDTIRFLSICCSLSFL